MMGKKKTAKMNKGGTAKMRGGGKVAKMNMGGRTGDMMYSRGYGVDERSKRMPTELMTAPRMKKGGKVAMKKGGKVAMKKGGVIKKSKGGKVSK